MSNVLQINPCKEEMENICLITKSMMDVIVGESTVLEIHVIANLNIIIRIIIISTIKSKSITIDL